MIKKKLLI